MKQKNLFSGTIILAVILIGFIGSFFIAKPILAFFCETDTVRWGKNCQSSDGTSWCNLNANSPAACAVESVTTLPANPTGGTYSFNCNTNSVDFVCGPAGYPGYTYCGVAGTCHANVAVPANCTSFNQCNDTCSACATGYELSGNNCVGATVKLGTDSVMSDRLKNSASPFLSILSSGFTGIGTTVPNDIFSIGNSGAAPVGSPNTGHNYTSTYLSTDNYALVNYGLLKTITDPIIPGGASSLWNGTSTGNIWNMNSGNVGIGTTNPRAKLDVAGIIKSSGSISNWKSTRQDPTALKYYKVGVISLNALYASYQGTFITNFRSITADNDTSTMYKVAVRQPAMGSSPVVAITNYNDVSNAGDSITIKAVVITDTISLKEIAIYAGGINSTYLYPSHTLLNQDVVPADSYGFFTMTEGDTGVLAASLPAGTQYTMIHGITTLANGNVGVGTTNPGGKLDVTIAGGIYNSLWYSTESATTGYNVNRIRAAFSPIVAYFGIGGSTASNTSFRDSFVVGTQNGYNLNLNTSDQARLTILSAGNVGIGTTAPNDIFSIGNSGAAAPDGSPNTGHNYTSTYLSTDDYALVNYGLLKTITDPLIPGGVNSLWNGTSTGNIWNMNSGNVGIGTVGPEAKLEVYGSGQLVSNLTDAGSRADMIAVNGSSSSAGSGGALIFGNGQSLAANSLGWAAIKGYLTNGGGNTSGDLTFATRNSTADTALTERLRILANGNIGIGTTNPGAKLQIGAYSDTSGNNEIRIESGGATSPTATLRFGTSESTWGFRTPDAASIAVVPTGGSTNRMSLGVYSGSNALNIISGGNVGIGTTAPNDIFSIGNSGSAPEGSPNTGHNYTNAYLSNDDYALANVGYVKSVLSSGLWATSTSGIYNVGLGNVGIGTTNPSEKLQVAGGITSYLGGATGYVSMIPGSAGAAGYVQWFRPDAATRIGYLGWSNGGVNNLGLNLENGASFNINGGNVGVGTTNPAAPLSFGSGLNNTKIAIYDGGAGNTYGFGVQSAQFIFHTNVSSDRYSFYDNTALSNEIFTIKGTGNVGIGTTGPNASLDIYNGALANRTASMSHYRNVLMSYFGNGNQTGTLKIVLPQQADTMIDITIKGYNYTSIGAWEARISGYVYSGTGGGWYTNNHKAQIIGSAPFSQIRLAYDGAKPVILLGNTSTVWSYGSFEITDVTTTYNNLTGWGTGWSSSLITSEAGLTTIAASTIYTYITPAGKVGIGTIAPNDIFSIGGSGVGAGSLSAPSGAASTGHNYTSTYLTIDDFSLANTGYVKSVIGAATSSLLTTVSGDYLPLAGSTMTGAIDMGGDGALGNAQGKITNVDDLDVKKLTATTIDPLYSIKGVNYATFVSSIAGGVKEEYSGKLKISRLNSAREYETVVDFAKVKEGSDLWVWRQVVDFNQGSVEAVITPYGKFAQVYYLIDGNKLIFRSDKAVEISYRLIAKRFDWRKWPTLSEDQTSPGLKIED